jgi:hypothetical protein
MESFTKPLKTIAVLHKIFTIEQQLSGMNYLKILVKNIAQVLEIKYVIIGHAIEPEKKSVQTDVVWAGDSYGDNFVYKLVGTPCEIVFSGNRVCGYPDKVAATFPEDLLLEEMGVESYFGAPILDANGRLKWLLVLLHDQKIENQNFYTAIIEFLAMRVGTELDRFYIEKSLKKQVAKRTHELENSNKELKEALNNIKQLSGLLPICAHCKKIRDDKGYWNQIEGYIQKYSEASFSHGMCPECSDKLYGEEDWYIEMKKKKMLQKAHDNKHNINNGAG